MQIHIDEVLDYVTCSKLYDFRYMQEINPSTTQKGRANNNSILELYDKALHKGIGFLFHSIQNGFYPGLNHLSNKWGYLWVKPRSTQEDIRFKETSWRDTHELKRQEGWKKLKAIHEYYKENEGTPIMVNYPYKVQVGRHTLVGEIDLVRTVRDEKGRESIELTEFVTDDKKAPFLHVRRDWRVTAAVFAFNQLMNVKAEKIVYHGVISGKLKPTERDALDFNQLKHLLDMIEKSQAHEIYYPVFNERCLTCPYEKYCEKGWMTDANN